MLAASPNCCRALPSVGEVLQRRATRRAEGEQHADDEREHAVDVEQVLHELHPTVSGRQVRRVLGGVLLGGLVAHLAPPDERGERPKNHHSIA